MKHKKRLFNITQIIGTFSAAVARFFRFGSKNRSHQSSDKQDMKSPIISSALCCEAKNSLSRQEEKIREFSADNEGQKSMLIQAQEILKPKMTSKEIIDYQFKILAWLRFSLESH